jgi:hypothetical protein
VKPGTIPADVRQLIVRHLGAALADAWRRTHEIEAPKKESPELLAAASGRGDVRSGGDREHFELYHRQP